MSYRLSNMGNFKECIACKDRYPACQDVCPIYIKHKQQLEKEKAYQNNKRQQTYGIGSFNRINKKARLSLLRKKRKGI